MYSVGAVKYENNEWITKEGAIMSSNEYETFLFNLCPKTYQYYSYVELEKYIQNKPTFKIRDSDTVHQVQQRDEFILKQKDAYMIIGIRQYNAYDIAYIVTKI